MAAKVITVFSNKGGVGKTFIAVNIACALAIKGKRTLIVDLNLQASQDMSCMLNLPPTHCLVDILADMEAPDAHQETYRQRTPAGCIFYQALSLPVKSGISPQTICVYFLRKASSQYDYIIVDGGSTFSEIFISILDSSNLILLVGTPDILAVYQVKTSLEILQSLHFPVKMVRLILNRAESRGGVAWQEVKNALACEVFSLIPSDGKTVGIALNRGIPMRHRQPQSKSFRKLL